MIMPVQQLPFIILVCICVSLLSSFFLRFALSHILLLLEFSFLSLTCFSLSSKMGV